ncbi:aspartate/methionine/tyrosine aminotransferase [Paraburkholderia sp. 32]
MNLASARQASYVSDELYHGLHDMIPDHSALEHNADAFVINGFSKYIAMTGWLLGWIVVPPSFVEPITVLAQHLYLSPPDVSQVAALACFRPETLDVCEQRRLEIKQRRDFLLSALDGAGFSVPYQPEGGFYVFADASRFTDRCETLCEELIEQAGVSVAPGSDFGDFPTYLRFSLCADIGRLSEAVTRIQRYVTQARPG